MVILLRFFPNCLTAKGQIESIRCTNKISVLNNFCCSPLASQYDLQLLINLQMLMTAEHRTQNTIRFLGSVLSLIFLISHGVNLQYFAMIWNMSELSVVQPMCSSLAYHFQTAR